MTDQGKKNLLGIWIDAVDYEAAVTRIIATAHSRQSLTVSALAVHGVMSGALDKVHRYRLNHLDLIVPDGQPVRWALNLLHRAHLADRVYGPTLMLQVCERAASAALPIYLYGSRPSVIQALSRNLRLKLPGLIIAGAQPSHFRSISPDEKHAVVEKIRNSGAAIVFVGLGCPRQEIWVYEYGQALSIPLVAVGAAFDFLAETRPQAPALLQRAGLEWLFRLVQEPARLWKRYVLLNPVYIVLLALQASGLVRFDPTHAIPPAEELRYG
jgi:N-acetylglucosaminyldiphosphoundecaprenol N-acetyl-beta-D-mannosaminyltransferase